MATTCLPFWCLSRDSNADEVSLRRFKSRSYRPSAAADDGPEHRDTGGAPVRYATVEAPFRGLSAPASARRLRLTLDPGASGMTRVQRTDRRSLRLGSPGANCRFHDPAVS